MKINNLKINKQKVASLIGTGIILMSLSGCSSKKNETNGSVSNDGEYVSSEQFDESLSQVIYDIDDLALIYKDGSLVSKEDLLIYVDKLVSIDRPVMIKFDSNIKQIFYKGVEVSRDDFKIVNKDTYEVKDKNSKSYVEISNIKFLMVDGNLYDVNNMFIGGAKDTIYDLAESLKTINEYEKGLCLRGITYSHEEVVRTYILYNIDGLSKPENSEVFNELLTSVNASSLEDLLGVNDIRFYGEDFELVQMPQKLENAGYMDIRSLEINDGLDKFINDGKTFGDIVSYGCLIENETQRSYYEDIIKRLTVMSKMNDTYELDNEFVKLTSEIKEGYFENKGIYAGINNGTLFNLRSAFTKVRNGIFIICDRDDRALTQESQNALIYLAPLEQEEILCSIDQDMFAAANECFKSEGISKTLSK